MRPIRMPRIPIRRRRIRSRNWFVVVMIVIAIVAVIGALLVYFVFVKQPERQAIPPEPPAPPKPVEPFQPAPIEKWEDSKKPDPEPPSRRVRTGGGRAKPQTLGDSAVGAGIRKLASRFNQCGRDYGAVDGSKVRVGFSISPAGSVTEVQALAPHDKTPLGRCVANVLGGASFGRSEEGRSSVRWSITLHP